MIRVNSSKAECKVTITGVWFAPLLGNRKHWGRIRLVHHQIRYLVTNAMMLTYSRWQVSLFTRYFFSNNCDSVSKRRFPKVTINLHCCRQLWPKEVGSLAYVPLRSRPKVLWSCFTLYCLSIPRLNLNFSWYCFSWRKSERRKHDLFCSSFFFNGSIYVAWNVHKIKKIQIKIKVTGNRSINAVERNFISLWII